MTVYIVKTGASGLLGAWDGRIVVLKDRIGPHACYVALAEAPDGGLHVAYFSELEPLDPGIAALYGYDAREETKEPPS